MNETSWDGRAAESQADRDHSLPRFTAMWSMSPTGPGIQRSGQEHDFAAVYSHSGHPQVVRVAAAQTEPILFDNAGNLAGILARIDTAAGAGAQLIVFPEMALTGYKFKHIEEALPFSETIPGPAVAAVADRARARGVHVVFGMLERDGQELYNASVLVGPHGYVGKYRKAHMGFRSESKIFSRGDTGFPVFQTAIGRIAIGICYDDNFPEAARAMTAVEGADIIAWPNNDGAFFWPELVLTRSTENNVFIVAANRIGLERFNTFGGNSLVAGPDWTTLVRADSFSDTIIYADVDLSTLNRDWVAVRQPRLYGEIAEPLPPQVMAMELNPESHVGGDAEVVVIRIVTASVRKLRPVVAELLAGGTAVAQTTGRTGPQGATLFLEVPVGVPVGTYTLRVTVDRDPGLRIEAPYEIQDVGRPRIHGARPSVSLAGTSGIIQVGFDRDVVAATGIPVVVSDGATSHTFFGSVNTSTPDNRLSASYSGLSTDTTYTATIPAGEVESVSSGAFNNPLSFAFTTVPADPFTVRTAVVQMDPAQGATSANLSAMLSSLDAAAADGMNLVVFPELALTGSGFDSAADARPHAEAIPGPSVDAMVLRAQALGVYAAFGMLEVDSRSRAGQRERLFSTYVLVGPEGLVGTYRKAHLSAAEAQYLDTGTDPITAFNTAGIGTVGLMLSDGFLFPEIARVQFLQGATTIAMGANLAGTIWPDVIRTRASESKIHIAVANRVGSDGQTTYGGLSTIASQVRRLLAQASASAVETVSADLNIESVLDKLGLGFIDQSTGKVRSIHYELDRRPDMYRSLTRRVTPGRR